MFKNVIISEKHRKNHNNFRFHSNTIRIRVITIVVINNMTTTTIEITTIIEIVIINKTIKIVTNNRFISRILDRSINNNDSSKNLFQNKHHDKKFSEMFLRLSHFRHHKHRFITRMRSKKNILKKRKKFKIIMKTRKRISFIAQ